MTGSIMTFDLTGRTPLITGSTGIAAQTAVLAGSAGAGVFVVSRTPENCERLAGAIRNAGWTCELPACDLPDADERMSSHGLCDWN
jgi:short-subunit dehydrogenase